ncbi:hypothetical protein GAMM_40232 [Gammaproteobacteria bacterium]
MVKIKNRIVDVILDISNTIGCFFNSTDEVKKIFGKKYKNSIQLKHFIIGKEAINFINTFPEKNKIYLLADKELMKQDGLTGMDVIKQTNLERATLVTSHYADIEVQKFAAESGIGILPKDKEKLYF